MDIDTINQMNRESEQEEFDNVTLIDDEYVY